MIADAIAILLIFTPFVFIAASILQTSFKPATQKRFPKFLCQLGIHYYATFHQKKRENESFGRNVSRCVRCGKYEYPTEDPNPTVQAKLKRNYTREYTFEEWSKNNERL